MTTPNYYRPGDPLDKLVPFLCPTCGGINDARQYTLMRIASGPCLLISYKKCECAPKPVPKHNGRLDEHDANISVYLCKHMNEVVIFDVEGRVALTPVQALSPLVWLEQERDTIYQLAKGQGDNDE